MINLRNESGREEARTCRACHQEFRTVWRYALDCDPCIQAAKAKLDQPRTEPTYKVPALYAQHHIESRILQAMDGQTLLVLAGPSRTGKTCQLHHLLRAHSHSKRVCYVSGSRVGRLQKDELESVLPRAMVGIDDIGRRLTPSAIDTVSDILDERLAHMLPTVVTTNVAKGQWMEIDERLAGRLGDGRWLAMTTKHTQPG